MAIHRFVFFFVFFCCVDFVEDVDLQMSRTFAKRTSPYAKLGIMTSTRYMICCSCCVVV